MAIVLIGVLILTKSNVLGASTGTISVSIGSQSSLHGPFAGVDIDGIDPSRLGGTLGQNLGNLLPTVFRFPSGVANYYNWHDGTFWNLHGPKYSSTYVNGYPYYLTHYTQTLTDLKTMVDKTHGTPIFVLNLITPTNGINLKCNEVWDSKWQSVLTDQLNFLKAARQMGISVKYVELGNEVYKNQPNSSPDETCIFPSGTSYGNIAKRWIDGIHAWDGTVQVGVNAVFGTNSTWNSQLITALKGKNYYLTIHPYPAPNMAVTGTTYCQKQQSEYAHLQTDQGVKDLLSQAYLYEKNGIKPFLNQLQTWGNGKFWFTEYNYSDPYNAIDGSWGSGLFDGIFLTSMLSDSRINLATNYTLWANANFSLIFKTTDAYTHRSGCTNAPTTIQDGLSSAGLVLTEVMRGMYGQKTFASLQFSSNPQLSGRAGSFPSLVGYLFSGGQYKQAIIFNLSSTAYTISLSPNLNAQFYNQLSATPSALSTGDSSFLTTSISGQVPPTLLQLPPYSITRLSNVSASAAVAQITQTLSATPTVIVPTSVSTVTATITPIPTSIPTITPTPTTKPTATPTISFNPGSPVR